MLDRLRGLVTRRLLGEHTDGRPPVVAADGGIIDAGDDGEILDDEGDERPGDCDCWDADAELPCWPCCRESIFSATNFLWCDELSGCVHSISH